MTFLHRALARAVPGLGSPRRRAAALSLVAAGSAVALVGTGVLAAGALTPPPAHLDGAAGLKRVGPIDEANGFPLWYEDTNGVKLELCLDPADTNCIMGDVPDPGAAVSFPDNFPDEAFWAAAEASIDAGGGEDALLVTALEAAFQNEVPAEQEQISFGRIRIRVGGLVDDAQYKVTHPFGTDTFTAEPGAVKGINNTEDIGSLVWDGVFDQTLGSRPGPFLKWTGNDAPEGYLGDVTVDHTVTGSPYETNFFRVEGPPGSFTGSTQLCADANLGLGANPAGSTDDCIETDLFAVQGKLATRMGVEALRATYRDAMAAGESYVDVFAKSEKDQDVYVSGTGVSQTKMRGDGKGGYFARILVTGAAPADLTVTNRTDTPDSTDVIEVVDDRVHVLSASYDTESGELRVKADSGDADAALTLDGFEDVVPVVVTSSTIWEWTVTVPAPPMTVTVSSDQGGSDSDDVVVAGAEFDSAQVVAAITPSIEGDVALGQLVTFDGTTSQGSVATFDWSITGPGTTVDGSGPSVQFTPSQGGDYTVTLEVTAANPSNKDTETYHFSVPDGASAPVADAGPDQLLVLPTSTVTLDGTASKFTSGFSWTAPPGIDLVGPLTANPTFRVPVTMGANGSWTFTLTATGVQGTVPSTSTVTVTSDADDLGIDSASFKRGGNEWRIRGTAQHCSANNTVTVKWNKPGVLTPITLGTATPAGDLGLCTWDFRLKNTPAAQRPTAATLGTITVTSVLGGQLVQQTYQFL